MSEPVRVLYVQRPSGGGSTTGLLDLIRYLDRERFTPLVMVGGYNQYEEQFQALGVKYIRSDDFALKYQKVKNIGVRGFIRLFPSIFHSLNSIIQARSDRALAHQFVHVLREERIDLVHNNSSPSIDRPSIFAASHASIPQISHVRGLRPPLGHSTLLDKFDRHAASHVNQFIYVSRAIAISYASLQIPSSKQRVIYDPFDLSSYQGLYRYRDNLRREFGVVSRERLIVNVGRITRWKGQDIFLRAIASVVREHPDVKALLVGSPNSSTSNQSYYQELQSMVRALGIESRVVFAGFRNDVPAIMAASDIVVHSATSPEPFGRVLVEAMAAGTPLVATAAGGPLEIVEDGKTGLLVPPGDPEPLAQALNRLLEHKEQAQKLSTQAYDRVLERFAGGRAVGQIMDLYEEVLAKHACATQG